MAENNNLYPAIVEVTGYVDVFTSHQPNPNQIIADLIVPVQRHWRTVGINLN